MFSQVYDAKVKKHVGPLTFFGKPNELPHPRLGLSVPRRVGTAVSRNRIKRYLREAFRLSQHDGSRDYDVIVVVRPHEILKLVDYQRMWGAGMDGLGREWEKRLRKAKAPHKVE
jgi:ribonuclease P protein component